jgi:hypothetical protein
VNIATIALELSIKENGSEVSVMAEERLPGAMVLDLKVNGCLAGQSDRESSLTPKARSMMGIGAMTKLMASVYMYIITGRDMKANGSKTYSMVVELRAGQIHHASVVNIEKAVKTE